MGGDEDVGAGAGADAGVGVDEVIEQGRARSSIARHEPHRCSETVGLVVAIHDPGRERERCGTGAGDQHPAYFVVGTDRPALP